VVVNRHSEWLSNNGWDTVIVTTDLYSGGAVGEIVAGVAEGVRLEVLPVDRPRLLGLSSQAARVLQLEVAAADLVQVHTLWHPLLSRVRKLSRQFGRPYLIMPHGMLDPHSLSVRRLRKAAYLALIERANLQAAYRMVYTTTEEQRLAEDAASPLPTGVVVPLGADAPDTDRGEPAREFHTRFPQTRGRRVLLFLSRIHPKKGLDRLLDVMPALVERNQGILLAVAGSGEEAHVDAARRRAEDLGLNDSVLFCGHLTGALKWGAYSAAEVFVLPSRQENFGIVVAEAMQMGLPVVVSRRVNTWTYIEKARAGIVCDGADLDELRGSVERILDDPASGRAMGERGRALARQQWTWSTSGARMEACYRDVLERWSAAHATGGQ
jgi:glycosyltransferase involved in cell wall biosynthesis